MNLREVSSVCGGRSRYKDTDICRIDITLDDV
jgi:hypothetical protein